jgi:hypothetical protein
VIGKSMDQLGKIANVMGIEFCFFYGYVIVYDTIFTKVFKDPKIVAPAYRNLRQNVCCAAGNVCTYSRFSHYNLLAFCRKSSYIKMLALFTELKRRINEYIIKFVRYLREESM